MPTLNNQMITPVRHAFVLLTSASVATATVKTKIFHIPKRSTKIIPLTAISAIAAALVDPNSSTPAKLLAYCGSRNFTVNGKTIHANTTTRKQKTKKATPHFGLDFSRVNVALGFAMRSIRFCQLSFMNLMLQKQR